MKTRKENKIRDFIFGVLAAIVILLTGVAMIWHATSPEYWYAGMHLDMCTGPGCDCYERLLAWDKAYNETLKEGEALKRSRK